MSKHHARLNPRRWEATRQIVFKRDGYRCMKCKKRGRLEAHHVISLDDNPDQDPYDVTNILTYCRSCHIAEHRTDNMTPGRAAWINFLHELTTSNQ